MNFFIQRIIYTRNVCRVHNVFIILYIYQTHYLMHTYRRRIRTLCRIDYSCVRVPCPVDFIISSIDDTGWTCKPMDEYKGSCFEPLRFTNLTERETKERIMHECKTVWPCVKCDRDYGMHRYESR